MVLDDIFERFAAQSPVTVMARVALEHALDPSAIDALFEEVAERQYTRTLLFSTVVDLMSTVVCNVRPAIHAAFQANAESIGVSLRAVYDKIDRMPPRAGRDLRRATPGLERLQVILMGRLIVLRADRGRGNDRPA